MNIQKTISVSIFLHKVDHNTLELHTEQSVSQLLSCDTTRSYEIKKSRFLKVEQNQ